MMILCNFLFKLLLDLLNPDHPCSVISILLFAMHCDDNYSIMLSIPLRSHRMRGSVVAFPIGIETNVAGPLMWMGKILQDYCQNVTEFDFYAPKTTQRKLIGSVFQGLSGLGEPVP